MKTLQDYEADEVRTLLQELLYRARNEDDEDLANEIESVIGLFAETKEIETDE
jgi:hypothetical protein